MGMYPETPKKLLLGPTSMSAVNIVGTKIHYAQGITPGVKFNGLSDQAETS